MGSVPPHRPHPPYVPFAHLWFPLPPSDVRVFSKHVALLMGHIFFCMRRCLYSTVSIAFMALPELKLL